MKSDSENFRRLRIGVLALQGDFEAHQRQLNLLGAASHQVKVSADLRKIDALIIPGGESTTMDKLIDSFDLREALLEFAQKHPIWGTCAGMIMLSKRIEDNQSNVKPFGLIDIDVVRNGYGRQVFSFEEKLSARLNGGPTEITGCFIRAPRITRCGEYVTKLAFYAEEPVLVKEGRIMASSFHTELDNDTRLLEFFLNNFLLLKPEKV